MANFYEINTASFEVIYVSSSLMASGSATIDFSQASYVSGTFFGEGSNLTSVTASYIASGSNTTASYALTSSFALTSGNSGTTLVTGSTYPITSSWSQNSISSSIAATASFSLGMPKIKSGAVSGSSFPTGNPRVLTVVFPTPFPNTGYAIFITSGDAQRTFTAENKTTSSFLINSNAKGSFSGLVYWSAISYGEYN